MQKGKNQRREDFVTLQNRYYHRQERFVRCRKEKPAVGRLCNLAKSIKPSTPLPFALVEGNLPVICRPPSSPGACRPTVILNQTHVFLRRRRHSGTRCRIKTPGDIYMSPGEIKKIKRIRDVRSGESPLHYLSISLFIEQSPLQICRQSI